MVMRFAFRPDLLMPLGVLQKARNLASDRGVHVLLLALTLAFGSMMALVFRAELMAQARLTNSLQTTGWTLYQAGIEFYRFQNALDRFSREPTQNHARSLKLRYEIFWSRIPILRESEEARIIQRTVDIRSYVDPIEAELRRLQGAIEAIESIDRAEIESVALTVGRMEGPIRDLTRKVVAFGDSIVTDELKGWDRTGLWMLGGVLACGVSMVGLSAFSMARNRRLVRETEVLTDTLAAQERSFRTLVESSPIGILIQPEPAGEIYANRALFAIFDVAVDWGDCDVEKLRSIKSMVRGDAAMSSEGKPRIFEWRRAGGATRLRSCPESFHRLARREGAADYGDRCHRESGGSAESGEGKSAGYTWRAVDGGRPRDQSAPHHHRSGG